MLWIYLVWLEHCRMYPLTMNQARRIPISSDYSMRLLWDPWYLIWHWLTWCSFDSLLCDSQGLRGYIYWERFETHYQPINHVICLSTPNASNCTNASMQQWLLSSYYTWMNEWMWCQIKMNLFFHSDNFWWINLKIHSGPLSTILCSLIIHGSQREFDLPWKWCISLTTLILMQ
jgi:hypothetical protein